MREPIPLWMDKSLMQNKQQRPLEFSRGEHVFLGVSPYTCVRKVIKSMKLTSKFFGSITLSGK